MTPSLISILEIHSVSIGARHLLTTLFSFRNRETAQCNPKIETLCDRVGAPRRTVERWMRECRSAGFLEVARTGRANTYTFHSVVSSCGKAGDEPATDGASRSATDGVSDPPPMAHQGWAGPYMNRAKEPSNRKEAADADVKATSSGGAEEKSAAAASSPRQQKQQRPASPPAEQLRLNLEPEPEPAPIVHRPESSDQIGQLAKTMAEELAKVHPSPGLPHRAPPEIERILRASPNVEATAERMWNNHAAWMEFWATLAFDRFIPHLWRWFRDGDWENPPVIRKPMTKADVVVQAAMRLHEEKLARRAGRC